MNTSEPGLGKWEGMPLCSDLPRVLVLYHPGGNLRAGLEAEEKALWEWDEDREG